MAPGDRWPFRAITKELRRIRLPNVITGRRPIRSTAIPTRGEKAYMPAMWRLITIPITRRPSSAWRRWSGVIDMTATITA